jgi:hypothetical protein
MTVLLAANPNALLNRSNTDGCSIERPSSPFLDAASITSARQLSPPHVASAASCISLPSIYPSSFQLRNENTPPRIQTPSIRSISIHSKYAGSTQNMSPGTPSFVLAPERQPFQIVTAPPSPLQSPKFRYSPSQSLRITEKKLAASRLVSCDELETLSNVSPPIRPHGSYVSLRGGQDIELDKDEDQCSIKILHAEHDARHMPSANAPSRSAIPPIDNKRPFKRWISTLRRKRIDEGSQDTDPMTNFSLHPPGVNLAGHHTRTMQHDKSGPRGSTSTASSSIGFVTAMKSATMTLASASLQPRSWKATRVDRLRSSERSSAQSGPEIRRSMDSQTPSLGPIMDEAAWMRSLQRRKVLEELIASEESYVADLKVLISVRITYRTR